MSHCLTHAQYLDRIQVQQQLLPCIILHFDPVSRDLRLWFWPITQEGARVTPSDFNSYRNNHNFRGPCCLCASDAPGIGYTESAIYVPFNGPYNGEYVAGCAYNKCGYLVNIERMYSRRGLLIDKYPLRQPGYPAPPTVCNLSAGNRLAVYDAQGTISAQFNGLPRALPFLQADETLNRRLLTTSDQLTSLDSWRRPGILESDFVKLFTKCRCGLITTRRVFRNHICAVKPAPVVIDLTLDFDDQVPVVIDLTNDD